MENKIDKVRKRPISIILIICMIASFLVTLTACNTSDTQNNVDNTTETILITGDEKNNTIDLITTSIKNLRKAGLLFSLQYGENTYATEIHSINNECMIQYDTSDTEGNQISTLDVYMNNYGRVSINDYISYDIAIDSITLLERAAYLSELGIGVLTKAKDAPEGYNKYYIDIRGYDNISSLYDFADEGLAYQTIEELRQSIALAHQNNNSIDTDHVNYRFEYVMVDPNAPKENINDDSVDAISNLVSAACYIYTGTTEAQNVKVDDLTTNWLFNGYHDIGHWKLDNEWYEIDWDTLGEMDDISNIEELLNKDYKKVEELLESHFSDGSHTDGTNDNNTNTSEE